MHQLPAFANMTMSVRRELCAVMVFAVVERAGTIVLNDGEEVGTYFYHLQIFFWGSLNKAEEQKPHSSFLFKNSGQQFKNYDTLFVVSEYSKSISLFSVICNMSYDISRRILRF